VYDTLVVMNAPHLPRLEVPGGEIAHRDAGSGPAVVLLHGGYLDHRMWTPQLASLADDHRVVALDARNHGGSSTATGPYRHCDDVAAVIRRLDLGPAVLWGSRWVPGPPSTPRWSTRSWSAGW
jgi:pimeloyl-ACP methyl ester carboxylesterase